MNLPFIHPVGCPQGINPADWRDALMQRIERQAAVLSALVDAFDAMEGDPDLEPWLGASEPISSDIAQLHWASGNAEGREGENEHGGDVQDEPHDPIDEGNSDYSSTDDLGMASQMNAADLDVAWDEGQRLVSKARAMLPPPTILQFERPHR